MHHLRRAWQASKHWPWWGHAIAVLVCLAALGGLLDALGTGDPSTAPSASPTTEPVPSTSVSPTTIEPTTTGSPAPTGEPTTAAPTTAAAPPTTAVRLVPLATTTTTVGTAPTPTITSALAMLDLLTVAAAADATTYRRDAFGPDWIDADHDCHNTRAEVLMRETLESVTFNANGCTVATGRWIDPWSGFSSTKASDFQIDHLVPLADAWRAGASRWTDAKRQAFAQNLDDPDALEPLAASVNISKGDRTPDQWKPPVRESWCHYATAWVRVKGTWALTVTPTEKAALATMLRTCA